MDETLDTGLELDPFAEPAPLSDPNRAEDPDNLVPELMASEDGKSWLKKRATSTVRLVRQDVESKKPWMEMREQQIKLLVGLIPRMSYPAAGGRAPHDPIIARTILQMWMRGREQLIPAKGHIIQATPVGSEDEQVALDREDHMNWQMRHKIPNYAAGVGESFLQYQMSGSAFREYYWDPKRKTTCFDSLTADDITVSYALKDIDPLMRRVPRVTRHLKLYKWEIEQYEASGEFPEGTVEKLYSKNGHGSSTKIEESNLEKQAQIIDGVSPGTSSISINEDGDDSALRLIHRVYMWMKLKGSNKTQAVTFIVDDATNTPISLKIREEEDPFDQARFAAETKVWELAAENTKAQYQQQLQQAQQMPGMPLPPPPPMPPAPAPVSMIPSFNVIHYRLFPNPNGFYGIGIAYLLTNANEMVNQMQAEYLLAARFANLKTGLLPRNSVAKGGEIKVEMGKFVQTNLEAQEMAGVREFSFSGPSEGLRKFIEEMKNDAYSLVADVDTLTGEAGPTNETKAAAQQRMANATTLMTAVTSLWLETFAIEPKVLAKYNGKYMDEQELYWITAPDKSKPVAPGQAPVQTRQQKSASRELYASEFDVTFTADQRLSTQPERIATATSLIQSLMASPYAQDPNLGPPLFYAAFLKLFRALDLPEMEKALGQPPQLPAPPPPPAPMSQVQENQMFMNEQDHPVLPDDNNEEHLMVIDDFRNSAFFASMSATGKQILDRHQRAHEAALYGQAANQGDQNGQQQSGAPAGMGAPGRPPGLGGPEGDGGVPGPAPAGAGGNAQGPSLPM